MRDYYILEGKKTVPVDLMTWAKWFEATKDRHVADEKIGDVRVSTVFLGVDHSFGGGPPMLFETMVFGGSLDQEQDRCTTWDEAEAMHKAVVERVKGANVELEGRGAGFSAERPSRSDCWVTFHATSAVGKTEPRRVELHEKPQALNQDAQKAYEDQQVLH